MKIQKLTIHNMASIEDATIDFRAAPLGDSDVYLITGKTGSGKSTILDGICLALYGTTPRFDGTLMQGKVIDAGKEVQVDDPANLLREGTGEGYVLLLFEGSDGIPYEAQWSIARAHKKPAGRLQGKEWILKDLRSGMTYNKDKEIKATIEKAVGLSFEQFCRTTMLAQGQFTRFLNSKDEEKAEILEMLTGVDIYSRIGAKVFEIARGKEDAYKLAKAAVEGIVLLTEAQKASKQEEIAGKKKAIEEASRSQADAKAKADWLDKEAELAVIEGQNIKALEEADAATREEAFLSEAALVRSFRETAEVRGDLATYTEESRKASEARRKIESLSRTYQTVRSGQGWLLDRKKALETKLADVKAALSAEAPVAKVIENAVTIYAQLDIVTAGVNAVSSLNKEIGDLGKEVTEKLVPDRADAEGKLAVAKKAKGTTAAALKTAEEALEAAGLPAIRKEISSLTQLEGSIKLAGERIGTMKETWNARQREAEGIAAKEKEIGGKEATRSKLFQDVCELKTEKDVAQRTYEAECAAKENYVGDMRRKLAVGDFCPVCMQEIRKALPTDAEVAARLKPIEDLYREANAAHEGKKAELDALDATIAAEKSQLEERKKAYNADTTLTRQKASVVEALKACGIESFDANSEYALGERAGQVQTRKTLLGEKEAAGVVLEGAVVTARKEDNAARVILDAATEAFTATDNALKEAQGVIDKKKAVADSTKKAVNAAAAVIDGIVTGSKWETVWKSGFTSFRAEVEKSVSAHNDAVGKRDSLSEEIRTLSVETSAVGAILQDIEKITPSWGGLAVPDKAEVADLSSVAGALKDSLLVENRNLTAAGEGAKEAWKKVEDFLSANPAYTAEALEELSRHSREEIVSHEEKQKAANLAIVSAKGALGAVRDQIREHAGKKPALEDGDTLESLRGKESAFGADIQERRDEITLLEAEIRSDDENRVKSGKLAARADALRLERDKWDRLDKMIGDRGGKTFRKIAQSYVLGSLVQAANHYMKELSERYSLKVVPGTFIIMVEDAYQGFSSRPASTISGGEGFLVSLSLALALSDIGDSLSVDTLFIDEGFGTLSGEPLQNAINTLKTLHTKEGRHVGIISHVEEVQEKIPVKILVEQNDRTSSSTIKVVPEV